MSWTSPQCSESTVDSVNSLPLEGSRRYKWPSTNTQERLLHWGRGWTAWYSDFRVTQRRCNSKKEVGWHGLPSANQFHQNGCVVTWTEKAFFTNNKTAFFPAQEFPQRNSPPLAPFEIVLRQHPGAWGKYFQPPSALLPPRHPNTLPFANTLYLALLISSNYCGFIQISSSLILPLSPLTLPSACGYNHLNIAFGSGFDHRHWVVFYCCAFRNHRGRWRGLSIGPWDTRCEKSASILTVKARSIRDTEMSWPGPQSLPLLRDWLLSTLTAHLRASSNGHYSKEPRFRETWCSGQSSRLAPRQPHLLLRTPFSLLLPLVGAGPSDLLLRNRRCQKQWECYLCKYVTKARCASTSLSPPALMNQAARTTRHRTEVRVHLKSQQGAEALPLPTNEGLIPPNKLWVWKWISPQFSFETRPQFQPMPWFQPRTNPEAQNPAGQVWTPDPQQLWDHECVSL